MGVLPGLMKGRDFRVGAPEAGMVAQADNLAIPDDHRADHGIGLDQAPAFLGFAEGEIHPGKVVSVHSGSILVGSFKTGKTRVANSSLAPGPCGGRAAGKADWEVAPAPRRGRRAEPVSAVRLWAL